MATPPLTLVGRSSSHFSRLPRLYAEELGVVYKFEPVLEIGSSDAQLFADNPLLTVPSLRTPDGTFFGAQNACRELVRRASPGGRCLWPEDLADARSANAQEIILSAMSAEVSIVMGRSAKLEDAHAYLAKPFARLEGALAWLSEHLGPVIAALPERRLSFLEVSAFAFVTHVEFRGLGKLEAWPRLATFAAAFGARPSAVNTPYRFDQPSPPTAR